MVSSNEEPRSSSFIYQPLEHPDSIRLLILQPANDRDEEISGVLIHTELTVYEHDILDPYIALSYVWGDVTNKDYIRLGESLVAITANLGAAIRDIRDGRRPFLIWVDALCINQADVSEQTQQVQLMGMIYRRASSTIIYLGSGIDYVDQVFDAALSHAAMGFHHDQHKKLSLNKHVTEASASTNGGQNSIDIMVELHSLHTNPPLRDADPSPLPRSDTSLPMHLLDQGEIISPGSVAAAATASMLKAIEYLCSCEWFSRCWVFQEVVLSKDPRVQCGSRRIRWETLLEFIRPYLGKSKPHPYQHLMEKIPEQFKPGRFAQMMDDTRKGRGKGKELDTLLRSRNGTKATDPRDLFYSLYGVVDEPWLVSQAVPIDYNKHPKDVYVSMARFLLSTSKQSIRLLRERHGPRFGSCLPSWVPDWGVQANWPANVHDSTGDHSGELKPPTTSANDILIMREWSSAYIEELSAQLPLPTDYEPYLLEEAEKLDIEMMKIKGWSIPRVLERWATRFSVLWDAFVAPIGRGNSTNTLDKNLWPQRHRSLTLSTSDNQQTMEMKRRVKHVWDYASRRSPYHRTDITFRLARMSDDSTIIVSSDAMVGDALVWFSNDQEFKPRRNECTLVRTLKNLPFEVLLDENGNTRRELLSQLKGIDPTGVASPSRLFEEDNTSVRHGIVVGYCHADSSKDTTEFMTHFFSAPIGGLKKLKAQGARKNSPEEFKLLFLY